MRYLYPNSNNIIFQSRHLHLFLRLAASRQLPNQTHYVAGYAGLELWQENVLYWKIVMCCEVFKANLQSVRVTSMATFLPPAVPLALSGEIGFLEFLALLATGCDTLSSAGFLRLNSRLGFISNLHKKEVDDYSLYLWQSQLKNERGVNIVSIADIFRPSELSYQYFLGVLYFQRQAESKSSNQKFDCSCWPRFECVLSDCARACALIRTAHIYLSKILNKSQ